MKSIAIIGGGLAGLAAGVFGQKAGFKTTIYEKNSKIGGCCFSWKRGEYTIDNCIHWLVGTKRGSQQNRFWEEIGGMDDSIGVYERRAFYTSELDGQCLTLWRDPEETRWEMLELSPEDADEINGFIDSVKESQTIVSSGPDLMNIKKLISGEGLDISAKNTVKMIFNYSRMNLKVWSERFAHPLIRKMILDFSAQEYEAFWLILSYAMFTSGDADVPIGGSGQLTERIASYYESLGGEICYNHQAEEILMEKEAFLLGNGKASGIRFTDGTTCDSDYIICTCEISRVFGKLLDEKHAPAGYDKLVNEEKTPIYSSFHAAFAVDGLMKEVDDLVYFPCDALDVGGQVYDRIGVKNYRSYGDYIAPEGQTVIQTSFIQYPSDFRLWNGLRANPVQYRLKKQYTVDAILDRLEKRFPQYKGKIHPIDSWTPATYGRYLGSNSGMYMRYITTILKTGSVIIPEPKDISNVFLAGHTLCYPGGTPIAALTGKLAIDLVENAEKAIVRILV